MRAVTLVLLIALGPALAGCIGTDGSDESVDPTSTPTMGVFTPDAPDFDFVDAIDAAHADHHATLLHTEAFGLKQIGHSNFNDAYPAHYQAGFTEIDVHGDLAVIASMTGFNGVTLVDISDRTAPKALSTIAAAGDEWDARFSPDGKYLFFGCQAGGLVGTLAVAVGDCTGAMMPHGPGAEHADGNHILAYDVTDPTAPAFMGIIDSIGAHNLYTATIDGEYYVFTDGTDLIHFKPYNDEGDRLKMASQIGGVHDVMVAQHPVTMDWLLYTGGSGSFVVYNVNDPHDPQIVLENGPDVVAWHEQTVSKTLIDGRVILVTAGEYYTGTGNTGLGIPTDSELGKLFILDVTDPTLPELLSTWELPVTTVGPWAAYRFSPHNIDISPYGQVAVGWYHAGVWVFDLSTQERQAEPVTLGFFQPHELPPARLPEAFFQLDHMTVPSVWSAAWTEEGRLLIPDMATGFYVLEPEWGLFPTW